MHPATRTELEPPATPVSEIGSGETEDCYIDDPIIKTDNTDPSDASQHDTSGLLWLLDEGHNDDDNDDEIHDDEENVHDDIDAESHSTSSFSSLSSEDEQSTVNE